MSYAAHKHAATRIKICGLRDADTIQAMDGLPLTEVGLVFAKSKRQVTIPQAKSLVKSIHKLNNGKVKAAGVFVNHPLEAMKELVQEVELDIIQLHGNEDANYYKQLNQLFPHIERWRVISITNELDINEAIFDELLSELTAFVPYIQAILIDAPGGGTGQPFNWEAIAIYRKLADQFKLPLYVAGGLNATNVSQLLAGYRVDGVDVSSGVETDGHKDLNKINEFVRKVIEA